jgi:hypothetical protein
MLGRLGIGLIVWCSFAAFVDAQSRTWEQVVQTTAGAELTLNLESGGTVRLRGWDRNAVSIHAHLGGRDWRDTKVTAEASPRGVLVRSSAISAQDKSSTAHFFDIWVPRRYDLSIHSAGGRLTIEDVDGKFHGEIGGGMITIKKVRGDAELSTGGGAIHITDSNLSGFVTTGGGSVTLRRVTGGVQTSRK